MREIARNSRIFYSIPASHILLVFSRFFHIFYPKILVIRVFSSKKLKNARNNISVHAVRIGFYFSELQNLAKVF